MNCETPGIFEKSKKEVMPMYAKLVASGTIVTALEFGDCNFGNQPQTGNCPYGRVPLWGTCYGRGIAPGY